MNIRFTSSLTADDENALAPVVLQTISTILNALPIAYMIRIDTSDSQVYQVSGAGAGAPAAMPVGETAAVRWLYRNSEGRSL